jgi:hypothetical protein
LKNEATAADCQWPFRPTWASDAPTMIRPQGGAAAANACRIRSITAGVAMPGTCVVISPHRRPAKIAGITGCFSMESAAPPRRFSRLLRRPPAPSISIRKQVKVSRISECTLMIISSGTSPCSPKP